MTSLEAPSKTTISTVKNISVVIPTLNRGELLLNTIADLLAFACPPQEIIVVDQTLSHSPSVSTQLRDWHANNNIRWYKQTNPSVVQAMNTGLMLASGSYALFLDDDIKPYPDLLNAYASVLNTSEHHLIAGRVIQPWDKPEGEYCDANRAFSFNALGNRPAQYFIGANFLVQRNAAIQVGGFDQNFKGASHDYEREFSDRMLLSGASIYYCGDAAVNHLKEESGGIRSFGHFLKTIKPHHSVGAYYYILRSKRIENKPVNLLRRLRERTLTRTHLKEPWWIPLSLLGNTIGFAWATYLLLRGPELIDQTKPYRCTEN